MAATATMQNPSEAWEAHDKAALSRLINRGIEIKQALDAMGEELKEINSKIYDMVGGLAANYRSNTGVLELKVSSVMTVPNQKRDALQALLGEKYGDLVEEKVSLSAKSGLRRLALEPGPHERETSDALRDILTITTRPSFTYKGFGKL